MNFSAILAPTAYIEHEEVWPHTLVKLLHKLFKDLFQSHILLLTHILVHG